MPAGAGLLSIVRGGALPKIPILENLDDVLTHANADVLATARDQLRRKVSHGGKPLVELACDYCVARTQAEIDHLRDHYFGDHDQGGQYLKPFQPIADKVRDYLALAIDVLIDPGRGKRLPVHSYWLEVPSSNRFEPLPPQVGKDDVGLFISSPPVLSLRQARARAAQRRKSRAAARKAPATRKRKTAAKKPTAAKRRTKTAKKTAKK
jgi:hypothetical protein